MAKKLNKNIVMLILKTLLLSFAVGIMLIFFLGWYFSAPAYNGPISDHFDGSEFFNEKRRTNNWGKFLQWMAQRQPGKWPTNIKNRIYDPPTERVNGNRFRITFVNHSTVLIQIDGINILTDPIWSERCSPFSFMGPKRARAPGVDFELLPTIEAVLVSHNHYDHLDIETLTRLWHRDKPQIFVGLGNKALLEKYNMTATELDWWQSVDISPALKLWSVPAQHFSNRGFTDRNKSLWMGFVIESPVAKIYFAGDTGYSHHFSSIYERFGAMDLALLPIGAFLPTWFMAYVHISPEEALKASQVLHARHSIGIHFGTFALADDAEDDPVRELLKAKKALKIDNFSVLDFGEAREFIIQAPSS